MMKVMRATLESWDAFEPNEEGPPNYRRSSALVQRPLNPRRNPALWRWPFNARRFLGLVKRGTAT